MPCKSSGIPVYQKRTQNENKTSIVTPEKNNGGIRSKPTTKCTHFPSNNVPSKRTSSSKISNRDASLCEQANPGNGGNKLFKSETSVEQKNVQTSKAVALPHPHMRTPKPTGTATFPKPTTRNGRISINALRSADDRSKPKTSASVRPTARRLKNLDPVSSDRHQVQDRSRSRDGAPYADYMNSSASHVENLGDDSLFANSNDSVSRTCTMSTISVIVSESKSSLGNEELSLEKSEALASPLNRMKWRTRSGPIRNKSPSSPAPIRRDVSISSLRSSLPLRPMVAKSEETLRVPTAVPLTMTQPLTGKVSPSKSTLPARSALRGSIVNKVMVGDTRVKGKGKTEIKKCVHEAETKPTIVPGTRSVPCARLKSSNRNRLENSSSEQVSSETSSLLSVDESSNRIVFKSLVNHKSDKNRKNIHAYESHKKRSRKIVTPGIEVSTDEEETDESMCDGIIPTVFKVSTIDKISSRSSIKTIRGTTHRKHEVLSNNAENLTSLASPKSISQPIPLITNSEEISIIVKDAENSDLSIKMSEKIPLATKLGSNKLKPKIERTTSLRATKDQSSPRKNQALESNIILSSRPTSASSLRIKKLKSNPTSSSSITTPVAPSRGTQKPEQALDKSLTRNKLNSRSCIKKFSPKELREDGKITNEKRTARQGTVEMCEKETAPRSSRLTSGENAQVKANASPARRSTPGISVSCKSGIAARKILPDQTKEEQSTLHKAEEKTNDLIATSLEDIKEYTLEENIEVASPRILGNPRLSFKSENRQSLSDTFASSSISNTCMPSPEINVLITSKTSPGSTETRALQKMLSENEAGAARSSPVPEPPVASTRLSGDTVPSANTDKLLRVKNNDLDDSLQDGSVSDDEETRGSNTSRNSSPKSIDFTKSLLASPKRLSVDLPPWTAMKNNTIVHVTGDDDCEVQNGRVTVRVNSEPYVSGVGYSVNNSVQFDNNFSESDSTELKLEKTSSESRIEVESWKNNLMAKDLANTKAVEEDRSEATVVVNLESEISKGVNEPCILPHINKLVLFTEAANQHPDILASDILLKSSRRSLTRICAEEYLASDENINRMDTRSESSNALVARDEPHDFRAQFFSNGLGLGDESSRKITAERFKNTISKSRELLTQLELEHRRLKGESELPNTWLERDLGECRSVELMIKTYSDDTSVSKFYNEQIISTGNRIRRTEMKENQVLDWRPPRKDTHRSGSESQRKLTSDGRHLFQFLHKRTKNATNYRMSERHTQSLREGSHYSRRSAVELELQPDRGRSSSTSTENRDFLEREEEAVCIMQQRSLSLPKTFLADKYGLSGFKAALPSVIFPWRRSDQSRERELAPAGCPAYEDPSQPSAAANADPHQDGSSHVAITSDSRNSAASNRHYENCPGSEDQITSLLLEKRNLYNINRDTVDVNSCSINNNKYEEKRNVAKQDAKTCHREGRRRSSKDGGVQNNSKRNVSNSPVYTRPSRAGVVCDTSCEAGGEYTAAEAGYELRQRPVIQDSYHRHSSDHNNRHNDTNCDYSSRYTQHISGNGIRYSNRSSETTSQIFNNPENSGQLTDNLSDGSYKYTGKNSDDTSRYSVSGSTRYPSSNISYNSSQYPNTNTHNHTPSNKSIGTQWPPGGGLEFNSNVEYLDFNEQNLQNSSSSRNNDKRYSVQREFSEAEVQCVHNSAEFLDDTLVENRLDNQALIETSAGKSDQSADVCGHQSLPHMTQLQLQQHLQQRALTESAAPNNGMFQKFKKSLSLRLNKKSSSRSESPTEGPNNNNNCNNTYTNCHGGEQATTTMVGHVDPPATLPRRRGVKEDDAKQVYLFGQPVFRSSKDRRKARLRDARASKCSSGDSGDSGIEIAGNGGLNNYSEYLAETATSVFHVSVNDHCSADERPVNADDGSCRISIPCDCVDDTTTSTSSCTHDQPCTCSVSCSCTNGAPALGSNSRQSLASTSSTTISSSLDSSNTSVTTISYGGPSHPSLTSCGSDGAQCFTNHRGNSCSACGGINRNSFHTTQLCSHPTSSAPSKIRRCQSDAASSINNLSNVGRVGRAGHDRYTCDKTCVRDPSGGRTSVRDTSGSRGTRGGSSRAHLSAGGKAVTDASGVRRSERRSEDETSQRNKSLKRSQGSTHLRRSVSQPLDLNKSPVEGGAAVSLRVTSRPTCGAAAFLHVYPHKRPQRRPSTGNLLSDDHTSEEELLPSDTEEARKERAFDESCSVVYAEALWDHVTMDSEELMFRAGELISVVDRSDHDWWWGRIGTRAGWFPVAFVRLLVNQQEHLASSLDLQTSCSRDSLAAPVSHAGPEDKLLDTTITNSDAVGGKVDAYSDEMVASRGGYCRATSQYSNGTTPRKASASGPTHDQIRANVIKEIITTERDFVKHLRDVVEGYLKQARRRPDMFSTARISAIFGNMEELYAFQTRFLADLEGCIDWDNLHTSCVGEAFIKNSDKFEIYSEYCNNHPFAVSELQELYQQEKYVHFFEACRLLQEMIDISLDGFLLTPVQKICKYPLQLQELLKYTKPDHPDHDSVQGALNAMRSAALLVNERRRRMECLEKIAAWQMELEGWEGAELLDSSSQLLHQGEVVKGAGGAWPKEVTLFLFDRQLVYCKKDIIKRNTYVYRGRINLDQCSVEDVVDSKDGSRSNYVPNAWRIRCRDKNKSYVFACKTAEEKSKWLEAFRRERELVAGDEEAGFLVSDKTRALAREAARTRRARPKKPRSSKIVSKRGQALTHAQAELLVNIDRELRSNSLPSHQQQQQQAQQQQQQQQQLCNTAPLSTSLLPADTSDNKRRGLWFSFGGQKKSRSQSRGGDPPQATPV
ncbi:serine-rich adhesin for platelets isoform X1 [Hyalella azteca]|uniref:Serine-rich adhesin for platelets isoform X1 n=1 Tax=Hyalella azteca TaxID=294128 RepID=A0A8B7NB72_HYAAZ|nr:serine-rich adhesin for platelets isoform X1 [Hyalella azteca]